MTMEQRIRAIMGQLNGRKDAELVDEVRGLDIFDDPIYRQKIRNAIGWAKIYIDPKQRAGWDSEAQSGREAVKGFLFSDLYEAANRVRKLRASPSSTEIE
jgi:hypothetical protein